MTKVDGQQQGTPVAWVRGEPFRELPADLYIPPEALEVFLETFEGPLDLLLYLIRKQQLDILDLPIARITTQYMQYVELMQERDLELAADYLVMAAILAEIKSRLLLPKPEAEAESDEDDPRIALVRRLREYELFKRAAEQLEELPRQERDLFVASAAMCEGDQNRVEYPPLTLTQLVQSMAGVLQRLSHQEQHRISRQPLSTRERMSEILLRLREVRQVAFSDLFPAHEGRAGAVVTFLAVLELIKLALIDVLQECHGAELQLTLRDKEPEHDGNPQSNR